MSPRRLVMTLNLPYLLIESAQKKSNAMLIIVDLSDQKSFFKSSATYHNSIAYTIFNLTTFIIFKTFVSCTMCMDVFKWRAELHITYQVT